jgi:uncharacterized protein YndB with AHSA1/START domain
MPYGNKPSEKEIDAGYRARYADKLVVDDRAQPSRALAVTFDRVLPGPIERVWEFLTDTRRLPQWFGEASAIEPRRGGTVSLMGGHVRGTVTQWARPHRLTYTWNVFGSDDGPDAVSAYPESYLSFTLESCGAEVRLRLQHLPILDRFEKQNAMGWHTFLDILGAHLRGETVQERPVYMKKNAERYGVDMNNRAQ